MDTIAFIFFPVETSKQLSKILYSSKIKFKPRQRRLAVLKYSLRLVS